MPERRSSDDRRISWHPTATGRSPGSHRWTTCRWPSGHRPKFRSSAKWIGRPPSSRLAVASRRPQPDLYDLVQGRENPAVICRCQKTGIGGKSADHRPILKACDAALKSEATKCWTRSEGEFSECTEMVHESEIGLVFVCDRSVFWAFKLLAVLLVTWMRRGASRPLLSFFHIVL